ncbi:MAG: hypothetical protein PHI67_08555 [Candidatus Methanomethylophilaceae archaeon]|nr:hypothetical protein [Candidatus Methanomethylophilaceae archaeon]
MTTEDPRLTGPPVCPECGKHYLDPFWDEKKSEVYHICPGCGYGARYGYKPKRYDPFNTPDKE